MPTRRLAAGAVVLAGGLLAAGALAWIGAGSAAEATPQRTIAAAAISAPRAVFPLQVSKNHRYLVDRRGTPFMIVGDSPQALIGNLSLDDAASFIANRKAAGFNALWVDLLCAKYTGCRDDGKTYDGIAPFRKAGDLSTPNPAYFARAAAVLRLAARAGMVVFLDPIETGSWLDVLKANGAAKDAAYGRFLGRRYKAFGNIIWSSGNDFQTWSKPADDGVVLAVAKGIRATAPKQLQTVELNYFKSGSRDDGRWKSLIDLDAAYTYYPTYAQVLREYNRRPAMPVYMAEAGYEMEQNLSWISKGDPDVLRRQEYWSMLSGASGQFYGNHWTWPFRDGWKDHLDTPGSAQMGYLVKLFLSIPWYALVPDQTHKIVTSGFGTFTAAGNVGSSDYVATASTPDGKLAVSYLPAGGTIVVDTARLHASPVARWYDPANGTYRPATAGQSSAAGASFTAPGDNADGDADWVLVLTAR
jgi:hypothetical protein